MALVPTITTVSKNNWNSVLSFNRDTQSALQKIGSLLLGPKSIPSFGGIDVVGPIDLNSNYLGNVGHIDFDLTPTATEAEGRMFWNADDGTLNLGMPGGSVNLQIGQEELQRVRNDEATTITNGTVVYISGSTGDRVQVKRASASSYLTSYVLGIATEDIPASQFGYITTSGLVHDIDTDGMSYGTPVWLSATSGLYTQTAPDAPNMKVFIGYVVRAHATEGILTIRPTVVPRVSMLSDIYGAADTTGQFPVWDQSNSYYTLTHNISEFQAADANLTAIAALTPADSNIIVGGGSTWVAETGATARTSLGLGTGDSPTFTNLTISTTSGVNVPLFACADASANYTPWFRSDGRSVLMVIESFRSATNGSFLTMRHARGTVASPEILQNNDEIASFLALGYDGVSAWRNAAGLNFFVDENPTPGNSPPTSIRFYVSDGTTTSWQWAGAFQYDGKFGVGTLAPQEGIHCTTKIRSNVAFNLNGTDGVTQASSAGKVCDVTALAGGIATAQTQITYAADGTYNFDATSGKVSSITITNGRITAITTAA